MPVNQAVEFSKTLIMDLYFFQGGIDARTVEA